MCGNPPRHDTEAHGLPCLTPVWRRRVAWRPAPTGHRRGGQLPVLDTQNPSSSAGIACMAVRRVWAYTLGAWSLLRVERADGRRHLDGRTHHREALDNDDRDTNGAGRAEGVLRRAGLHSPSGPGDPG